MDYVKPMMIDNYLFSNL